MAMGSSVSVMSLMVCAVTVPVYTDLSQSQTEHNSTSLLHVVSAHILHNMLRWVHRHMDESTEIKCIVLPIIIFIQRIP